VAVALEQFVRGAITEKNFSQAFATAAEVAQTREGDCTEHAVLLAALLRARRIPARCAMGLVYFPQADGAGFAYHMWTEAWINDRWIPLDGTLGRGGIGGGHLELAHSNLKGAGPYAAFLPVFRVLGQLELEVIQEE
jgi:transglutaminase-like putative cysteine protease